MNTPSTRAQVVTRRTYNRPKDKQGKTFENWSETVDRVIWHQRWLWKRALKWPLDRLDDTREAELEELRQLMLERKAFVSGRTLWLGGTEIAKRREASMFNCAFGVGETVNDSVDYLWLLLQGCGVGGTMDIGTLNGFSKSIDDIRIVRSTRTEKGGRETNKETWIPDTRTWIISVGDSAEAWAKAIGKLLAGKYPADTLVFDFSEIRPEGERLEGYGWICSGDSQIAEAFPAIARILSRKAGQLLSKMDLGDIFNWLGSVLSSRRSAEIITMDYGDPEWREFAVAKREYWNGNPQRRQSNNALVFWKKPTKVELEEVFRLMIESGGSEPGFINGAEARRRAPWFKGVNPCGEILLPNKGFCNLVEVDIGKFNDDNKGLARALYVMGRANYRQTCVNLDDGILSPTWHQNNEFLRLCGVGLTGIVSFKNLADYVLDVMKYWAIKGTNSMADELGLPRSKLITTMKPSGTLSKIADTTEGAHKPLGKYIFNNINFSAFDPLVAKLKEAGYRTFQNPDDKNNVLVTFPVSYENVQFDIVDGKEVNLESAIEQLERYKLLMNHYVQHNASITISYDPTEVPRIIDWLLENWDCYVGVSWLFRNDPTKTAADLGYLYLPQEVVTKETYDAYAATLKPVDIDSANSFEAINVEDCVGGVCPVR